MIEFIKSLQFTEKVVFLISVLIFLIFVAICVANHLVSFKWKGLKIGVSNEDEKLREQNKRMKALRALFEYLDERAEYAEKMIHKLCPNKLDDFYVKYLASQVKETIVKWIVFEKLSKDENFIKAKQKTMISVVKKLTNEELAHTRALDNIIETQVENIIDDLIDIEKSMMD